MKNLILVMMVVFVAACTPEKKTLAEESLTPTEDDQFEEIDSPLYVQLGTRWEMDTTGPYELNSTCEIPKLAPKGTMKTCTFTVPEAKLFYSGVKFLIGTSMPNVCSIITFDPYYYRRSTAAAFKPPGEDTALNCSATPPASDKCYGGAAPLIVGDFPKYKGEYFNTNIVSEGSFTIPPENKEAWYGGEKVNYLVTNNITDGTIPVGGDVVDARTGEWHDYSISCTDIWNEPQFTIKMIIEDENWDPNGTGSDQFPDWP